MHEAIIIYRQINCMRHQRLAPVSFVIILSPFLSHFFNAVPFRLISLYCYILIHFSSSLNLWKASLYSPLIILLIVSRGLSSEIFSLTIRLVTKPLAYLLKISSCPMHNPRVTFISQFNLFRINACARGLHMVQSVTLSMLMSLVLKPPTLHIMIWLSRPCSLKILLTYTHSSIYLT